MTNPDVDRVPSGPESPHNHPNTLGGRRGWFGDPALGFVLFFAGIALIVVVSMGESARLAEAPWARAIVATEGEPLTEDAYPILAKRIPVENFPDIADIVKVLEREEAKAAAKAAAAAAGTDEDGDEDTSAQDADAAPENNFNATIAKLISKEKSGLENTEWFFSTSIPQDELKGLVASGRMPEPRKHEVLAGAYARLDTVKMLGIDFKVVGRLKPTASGLYFAYLVPSDETFDLRLQRLGATRGWIEPNPGDALRTRVDDDPKALDDTKLLGGVPSLPIHSFGVIAGLMLVAMGGAILQLRFFARLQQADPIGIGPSLTVLREWPYLVAAVHVIFYGFFFVAMLVGMRMPVANMMLMDVVRNEFSEGGGLQYVGDAYASGNIAQASAFTWVNNFLVQTVLLVLIPTIIVPLLGMIFALFKTLLTFSMVGFAMSPVWAGINGRFSYHSVTMTLELEAYVIAMVFVCLWPVFVYRIVTGKGRREALLAMPSVMMLTGLMLAVAATYEAVTLILLK